MRRGSFARAREPRCPTCGGAVAWRGNPHRPFCSVTCRLIDLGVWLDERYRVPGRDLSPESLTEDPGAREGG
ncbi:MAG TPA: DNA gyrase inhibitor YacG [Methylomirabilota bacterium]|nr:DNA gyrase inhibitor YacG [Methylomirabilota bacterium]